MGKITVLVVDDSFFMRKVISDILNSDPEIEVVGEASNGVEALEKINQLHPQVVTMDYEMPHLDGLSTVKKIIEQEFHPAVIVVSGFVEEGGPLTLRFLEAGAVDFVPKPSGTLSLDMAKVKDHLIEKIKIAAKVDTDKLKWMYKRRARPGSFNFKINIPRIVVIGSSTGGPAALEVLLPQFPANFPYPVLVAQHLPREFINSFAERLQKECQMKVVIATEGMPVQGGVIYLAPGGADTEVRKTPSKIFLSVKDNPDELESPSVDKLMSSAAIAYENGAIGIILTGMGKDGSLGAQTVKENGGKTIVQDESTSVVYGMGREVIERGLADDIVSLDSIVERLSELVN
jgi:two-component system, chemotaxis family, protein-glutamate methylesterase/glutaminase